MLQAVCNKVVAAFDVNNRMIFCMDAEGVSTYVPPSEFERRSGCRMKKWMSSIKVRAYGTSEWVKIRVSQRGALLRVCLLAVVGARFWNPDPSACAGGAGCGAGNGAGCGDVSPRWRKEDSMAQRRLAGATADLHAFGRGLLCCGLRNACNETLLPNLPRRACNSATAPMRMMTESDGDDDGKRRGDACLCCGATWPRGSPRRTPRTA